MRFPWGPVVVAIALALAPVIAFAGTASIGYLSFDVFIPGGPGSPGVNAFTVGNLTGDPNTGGFAVPPSFPVLTFLTFKNSSLQLFSGGSLFQTLILGDIGSGFFSSTALQFPDTQDFSSALLTATLDTTIFQLDGGGSFIASSDQISAVLQPSAGGNLIAGTDFAGIDVSGDVVVPEPGTFTLLSSLVPVVCLFRRRRCP